MYMYQWILKYLSTVGRCFISLYFQARFDIYDIYKQPRFH